VTDASHDRDETLQSVLCEVLTEHGPMTEERLVAAVSARWSGLAGRIDGDPGDAVLQALDADGCGAGLLADDRWVWLPALLGGRVLTHRISAAETAHGLISIHPDLSALITLVDFGGHTSLADGAPVAVVRNEFDPETLDERDIPAELVDPSALLLPAGYLSERDIAAGDTIGMRLTSAGLELAKHAVATTGGPALAGLARRLGDLVTTAEGEPVDLDTAIWTACADESGLFTEAVPPLTEMLPTFGLTWEDEWLAGAGFDFARWRAGKRLGLLADRYQLSEDEAATVLVTVSLYDQVADLYSAAQTALASDEESDLSTLAQDWGLDGPQLSAPSAAIQADRGKRGTVRAALAFLVVPQVADAVLSEILGADGMTLDGDSADDGAAALVLFAETSEPMVPREARVALRWMRAKAYERLGDVARAEATYLEAQTLDGDWPLTLVDLARYASDRGDAVRGLSLLERAGAPSDDPLVELLRGFQPTPRPELGRNQPCWCGSGRKYKVCHSRRETFPLADRAAWLYQKAAVFLDDGTSWREMVEVAAERARYVQGPEGLSAAIHDPLVGDLVLFEGGYFEEFVALRGELLPDDERSLAEQWLLVDRSVYEVCDARPGDGLTMRDIRTGDVHEVRERTASRQLKAGELVCARVVPAGDTMQIFGGLEPVALGERDHLVALLDSEPEPVELAEFLTRRYAPARLANTEGEPLVLCEATLRSADPESLAAVLDREYERTSESGTARWHELVTTDGMQRIRATLELDRDRLEVNTNSEARMDRVLATVGALATLESQTREPARDAREMSRLAARSPGTGGAAPLDPSDPQIAAVLAQVAREYERSWPDQPLPALAGYTPRQAAADPTRRDDLSRLLASFPDDPDNPAAMSPRRLRTELGL
jgi:hypothetical protein